MNNYIIFDSECPFCNKTIIHLAKLDKLSSFYFVANNSKKGKELILEFNLNTIFNNTIITVINDRYYIKSKALIMYLKYIKRYSVIRLIHKFLPLKFSDLIYSYISLNRRKIISNCSIPNQQLKSKFILK